MHARGAFLFARRPAIVGMVHVRALPGTPRHREPLTSILATAVEEAVQLRDAGVDGLIVENMHDVPYLNRTVGPEITAAMTAVAAAVKRSVALPLGVQILAAANREALAAALAAGADFIRAENFAYAHVADEGLMPRASAGPLLRYRRRIGAEHLQVFADVKKKHASHAITADVPLEQAARTAEFFGADAVIITGTATGSPPAPDDVRAVRAAVRVPVAVGSGVTRENLPEFWPHADALIIGSDFKRDGLWSNALDAQRVARLLQAAARLRAGR